MKKRSTFGFNLHVFEDEYGNTVYKTEGITSGTPVEIVILQMQAFLKKLKKAYFKKYNQQQ